MTGLSLRQNLNGDVSRQIGHRQVKRTVDGGGDCFCFDDLLRRIGLVSIPPLNDVILTGLKAGQGDRGRLSTRSKLHR